MKYYNFRSDDRLHKTRFCKKRGANQNFPHKEEKGGGLERFLILMGGWPKRGGDFLRGVHTLVTTMKVK